MLFCLSCASLGQIERVVRLAAPPQLAPIHPKLSRRDKKTQATSKAGSLLILGKKIFTVITHIEIGLPVHKIHLKYRECRYARWICLGGISSFLSFSFGVKATRFTPQNPSRLCIRSFDLRQCASHEVKPVQEMTSSLWTGVIFNKIYCHHKFTASLALILDCLVSKLCCHMWSSLLRKYRQECPYVRHTQQRFNRNVSTVGSSVLCP